MSTISTLKLKKKGIGSYAVKAGNIEITIQNPKVVSGIGTDGWQILIMDWSKEDEDCVLLNEYCKTKKQAVKCGANWVIENL